MKLISARQAWGDAYHHSQKSILEAAAQRAELELKKDRIRAKRIEKGRQVMPANETRWGVDHSIARCEHMLAAGLVQSAIATLAPPLQHLGHFLYSPIATGIDQNRAHSYLYFSTDLPKMHKSRQETAYWLALAALYSWRGMVSGQEEWWPAKIAGFLSDYGGVKIYVSQWARDWADTWEAFLSKVNELDAKALAPVANVVQKQREAA
ncbi:hypothetical protein ACFSKY_00055 [Azotobacter chroococcum]|uniref:Uncharacterized protein n=1 Tax=Azotobacter chroococcum TaxID=353 RepID=A0A4R1PS49_9GAMM|nr:hypothetical protein [Azotobacter chroococcum]TBV95951.1 hypothetical protein E0E53_12130 [Azotobacter chroococcum]TCL26833.1 hypothetical protein EV691_12939 [Azotobacter chroococcum]